MVMFARARMLLGSPMLPSNTQGLVHTHKRTMGFRVAAGIHSRLPKMTCRAAISPVIATRTCPARK
jgi:hypothetical protein